MAASSAAATPAAPPRRRFRDLRAAVRQHERRSGAGVFQRRHQRGHHHRPDQGLGARGGLAQHGLSLQGQAGRRARRSRGSSRSATCSKAACARPGGRVRITAQLIDGANGQPRLGRALRPRPERHLRAAGRDLRGHRQGAEAQAAARGEEGDRAARHRQRRGLQPVPDGAPELRHRHRAGPAPRRGHRAPVPPGDRDRPRLCPGLGADGAGPDAAAFRARAAAATTAWPRPNARSRSTPNLAEAHAVKARVLSQYGRHDEAAAEIEIALRLDPESYEVNKSAAYLRVRQQRFDEAIRYFEKAMPLMETDVQFAQHAADLLRGRRRSRRRAAARHTSRWRAPRRSWRRTRTTAPRWATAWRRSPACGEAERAKEWIEPRAADRSRQHEHALQLRLRLDHAGRCGSGHRHPRARVRDRLHRPTESRQGRSGPRTRCARTRASRR